MRKFNRLIQVFACSGLLTAAGCDVPDEALEVEAELDEAVLDDSPDEDAIDVELEEGIPEDLSAEGSVAKGLCSGYKPGASCTAKCNGGWYNLGPNVAYGHCEWVALNYCTSRKMGYEGACWSW